MPKVSVIYYSATGTVHALAVAAAEAAEKEGAEVRLRPVEELAPKQAIAANPVWKAHHEEVAANAVTATHDDLRWADAVLFGSPSRFGTIASQVKQFIDSTGGMWQAGELADKVYGAFTAAATDHGGHEMVPYHLSAVFTHWGGVIVPPGYPTPDTYDQVGNPYGASAVGGFGRLPEEPSLTAVRYQAQRVVSIAWALRQAEPPSPVITGMFQALSSLPAEAKNGG